MELAFAAEFEPQVCALKAECFSDRVLHITLIGEMDAARIVAVENESGWSDGLLLHSVYLQGSRCLGWREVFGNGPHDRAAKLPWLYPFHPLVLDFEYRAQQIVNASFFQC